MKLSLLLFFGILMYCFQVYNDYLIIHIVKWILYLLIIANLTYLIFFLFRHISLFGTELWRLYKLNQNVIDKSINPISYFGPIYYLIGISLTIISFFSEYNWLPIGLYALSTYLFNATKLHLPPVALLLGRSSDTEADFHANLNKIIAPFQTISSLIVERRPLSLKNMSRAYFMKQATHRNKWGDNWITNIKELMDIAKIIILDTREVTSAILIEIEALIHSNHTFKTVFIVGSNGEKPVIDKIQMKIPDINQSDLAYIYEEDIYSLMKYITKAKENFPTPKLPTKSIIKAF